MKHQEPLGVSSNEGNRSSGMEKRILKGVETMGRHLL